MSSGFPVGPYAGGLVMHVLQALVNQFWFFELINKLQVMINTIAEKVTNAPCF